MSTPVQVPLPATVRYAPDYPVETARRLLTTVHGLLTLQLMKSDAEIRVYAREQISSAIDALVSG